MWSRVRKFRSDAEQDCRIKYGGYRQTHLSSNTWTKSWGDGNASSGDFIPVIEIKCLLPWYTCLNYISIVIVLCDKVKILSSLSQFSVTYWEDGVKCTFSVFLMFWAPLWQQNCPRESQMPLSFSVFPIGLKTPQGFWLSHLNLYLYLCLAYIFVEGTQQICL